ncbi:HlyD family secretion protein [Zavarzinella formosa]|uniref:HlyD family secretion protein n=1 Tax=Zavarzinella formosa TaxID=360055 RepID=UPI0002FF99A7|nr:HlyD family secretion protein [Zavarzinella formosa]
MWADTPIIRLIAFSCLIGFVVFCLSYSTLVWRRRNRSTGAADAGFLQRYRGWFVTSGVLGILLLAVSAAVREAVSSEAVVTTESFFIPRASEDMHALEVAKEGPINKGDLLVKFTSPKVSAELDEARLKLKRLEAEQKALPLQPLPLDSELIRRHQNAESAKRTLQDSQNVVLSSLETAVRELRQQIDTKHETLTKTDGELEVNTKELRQAEDRLRITRVQLDREQALENRGAIPATELDERRKEVSALVSEVAKQQSRQTTLTGQKKQTEEMLATLKKLEKSQTDILQAEHARIRIELVKAATESGEFHGKLVADTERATKLRASEIEQMSLRVGETRAMMNGLQERLERRAPFSGRVFYAHPSGAAAPANAPIVVLGPEDGFRTRVRIPATQLEALKTAKDVTLDVGEGQLARVFPATFRQSFDLPSEPNYVIAELDTNPSAEAVKVMAEDSRMKARLTWRFPIWTFWPFKISLFLIGFGLIGYFLGMSSQAMSSAVAAPQKVPATTQRVEAPKIVEAPKPTTITVEQPRVVVPVVAPPVTANVVKTSPPSKASAPATPTATVPTTAKPSTEEGIFVGTAPVVRPNASTAVTPIVGVSPERERVTMVAVKPDGDTKMVPFIRDLVKQEPIVVGPSESSKLLEVLAVRLRDSINQEKLEIDLVESAEWAFQQHGQRAVRIFRQVFREDTGYVPHMRSLYTKLDTPLASGPTAAVQEQRELVKRTGKILEAIGARFLSPASVA